MLSKFICMYERKLMHKTIGPHINFTTVVVCISHQLQMKDCDDRKSRELHDVTNKVCP